MNAEEISELASQAWKDIQLSICFRWAAMPPEDVNPKSVFGMSESECLGIIRKAIRATQKQEKENDD